jgi:signal transduction histidine kinase
MTGQVASGLAQRLYRKFGARYVHLLLGVGAASIMGLTVAAAALLAFPYLGGSMSKFLHALTFALPWMTLVAFGAEQVNRRMGAPLIGWLHGPRGAEGAEAAWRAAVVAMPQAVLIGTIVVVVGAIPAEVYGMLQLHPGSLGAGIAAGTAVTLFIVAGGALHYLLWERSLVPVVSELARHLPEDFEVPRSAHTLSRKLLVLVVTMNGVSCLVAAGVSTNSLGPGGKVAVGIGTAGIVAVTLGLGVTLLLRRSLVTPLAELLWAMDQLRQGDLDVRLPMISADEVGAAREHFNSMAAGLQERESLRERNVALVEELQASRARIVAASNDARRRVERDLHDGAQQQLIVLNLRLALLARQLPPGSDERAVAEEARADAQRALTELRDLAHGIYPQALISDGLCGALAAAAEKSRIPVRLSLDGTGRYSPEIEAAVYFCCVEALQNAAKHAGAGACAKLGLAERAGRLTFTVADDGAGFQASPSKASNGLQNMIDRIGALGGQLRIQSAPGSGTTIVGSVPVQQACSE